MHACVRVEGHFSSAEVVDTAEERVVLWLREPAPSGVGVLSARSISIPTWFFGWVWSDLGVLMGGVSVGTGGTGGVMEMWGSWKISVMWVVKTVE